VERRFWPGLLWLTAAATGESKYAEAAQACHGGLVDGCYNARQGPAPRNELIWGDYFALEAALGLRGTLATATL
jgi:hypothetical protein